MSARPTLVPRFLAASARRGPLVVRALLAPLLELGEAAAEVLELLVLEDDDVRGGLHEAAVVGHEQYRRRPGSARSRRSKRKTPSKSK